MPRICLEFVIVVFLDHTHLLFLVKIAIIDRGFITGPIEKNAIEL